MDFHFCLKFLEVFLFCDLMSLLNRSTWMNWNKYLFKKYYAKISLMLKICDMGMLSINFNLNTINHAITLMYVEMFLLIFESMIMSVCKFSLIFVNNWQRDKSKTYIKLFNPKWIANNQQKKNFLSVNSGCIHPKSCTIIWMKNCSEICHWWNSDK